GAHRLRHSSRGELLSKGIWLREARNHEWSRWKTDSCGTHAARHRSDAWTGEQRNGKAEREERGCFSGWLVHLCRKRGQGRRKSDQARGIEPRSGDGYVLGRSLWYGCRP